jgi:Skp family chaperone for outer membrane proteins
MVAVGVIFVVGFSRHGMDFIRHGFKQNNFDELIAKLATKEDIAELRAEVKTEIAELRTELKTEIADLRAEVKEEIANLRREFRGEMNEFRTEMNGFRDELNGFRGELENIKVNHFGHLKNFLTELTSILVDRNIITNENKARLDNHLRGM